MGQTTATDDRTPAEISFAATNMVKSELTSRRKSDVDAPQPKDTSSNLRGERQVFPPTPPPEDGFAPSKPIRANTVAGMGNAGMGGRSLSLREREDAARRDHSRGRDPGYGPRHPAAGALVEPRRAYSARGAPSSTRSRSVREIPPPQQREPVRRRPERPDYSDETEGNPYNDDLYDMYGSERRGPSRGAGSVRRAPSRRVPPPRYEDEDEYASDAYEGSSFDEEDAFEMLDSRSVRSGASRRPDVKKVRLGIDLIIT